MFRRLNPAAVHATAERLAARVSERFPDRGLSRVAAEVVELTRELGALSDDLERPVIWARAVAVVVTVGLVGLLAGGLLALDVSWAVASGAELVQALESLINDVVFGGAAVWFVWTLEGRVKRHRALRALSLLRSVAHVVDMHQLDKDPASGLAPTASSPTRDLHGALLARYLSYCTEILSMLGKLAALTGQDLDDPVVLSTVEEIEELTSGLSNKIWQKIVLVEVPPSP